MVIESQSTVCACCGGGMHSIGEDVAKRLHVLPVQYRVIATHRPKYACRSCEGQVVQAPAPARLIEGGLRTEALVADVIVGKYADHDPLYRQSQALARQGIILVRRAKNDQFGDGRWGYLSAVALADLDQWIEAADIREGLILRAVIRAHGLAL